MPAIRKCATVFVGIAGWTLPRIVRGRFPSEGSSLQRYAARLPVVEVNSSFYRPHRPATYGRWADSVPARFRFSVKVPKTITHAARLIDTGPLLDAFLTQVSSLGPRLGCLLVQLPPGLAFDSAIAGAFFAVLRDRFAGLIALEPRHPTWFTSGGERLLVGHRITRVAADPAVSPSAGEPGGSAGFRLLPLARVATNYFRAMNRFILSDSLQKSSGTRVRGENHLLHLRQYGARPSEPKCARPSCDRAVVAPLAKVWRNRR